MWSVDKNVWWQMSQRFGANNENYYKVLMYFCDLGEQIQQNAALLCSEWQAVTFTSVSESRSVTLVLSAGKHKVNE